MQVHQTEILEASWKGNLRQVERNANKEHHQWKYKPLITLSSGTPDFSILQDDVCITPQVDRDVISATRNSVIPTHISGTVIATPNIGSFLTPDTPQFHSNSVFSSSFSWKLDSLEAKRCGKIMAMKSFFMDKLHSIKNESLFLKNLKHFNQ